MIKFKDKISFRFFLIIIVLSSMIFLIPNIPNSYAHAIYVNSDPKPSQSLNSPPSKIDVYFNDPVDIHYSQLKVLDPNGKEIQNKDLQYINNDQSTLTVTLPSGLPNGVYTVSTKVLDETDGHVTENAFVFAVGVLVPKTSDEKIKAVSYSDVISIPDVIPRFPSLLGQVIVVGAAFSSLWLWRPISRIKGLNETLAQTRIKIDRSATKLILVGSIIVVASSFGMIIAEAYSINAGFGDAVSTKFGHSWLVRMLFSVPLLVISFIMYFKQKKSNSTIPRRWSLTLFLLGLSVLATTSIISHGAASGNIMPFLLDLIHNFAASIWIGGILYIDWIIIAKLKQISDNHAPSAVLSIIIPKFSTVVLPILGTVLVTGPFLLYVLEGNLSLTVASIYGKILIAKLSLAAIMIAAGAYHQISIHRHAFKTTSISFANSELLNHKSLQTKSLLSKFGISAKIESAAGILLIVTVAMLVNSGLPGTEFQDQLIQQNNVQAFASADNMLKNTFTQTTFVENDSRIVLTINPFFVGSNNFVISFLDKDKNLVDIGSVNLALTQTDRGIGPLKLDAVKISKGVYSAKTDAITFPGHWKVHVEGIPTASNSLSLVGDYELLFKPQLSQMNVKISEFKTPDNSSLPLYPVFDSQRNVLWTGDTKIGSGRILEFNLDTKNFTEHKLEGTNIVTLSVLDSKNQLWYIDPISKIIGNYNPDSNSNNVFSIPSKGILSGLAIDDSDNLWLTVSTTDEIFKFNPQSKNFTSIKLATGSVPLGIYIDGITGKIWVAESSSGKIAEIEPSNNYKITEYAPTQQNATLASPTSIVPDPISENIYISEHDGQGVTKFDPLLKTFTKYPLDPQGLPFGMTFDNNGDLWIAQHTIDKIAVIDTRTGDTNEFDIPSSASFTQYVTTDSQGNVILVEQRAHAIGVLSTTANPAQVEENNQTSNAGIPQLGFSFADVVAPSIMTGFIAIAFFFSRSVRDLRKSEKLIKKDYDKIM